MCFSGATMVVSYCLGFAILLSLATPSSFSQVLSETILTFDFVFLQKTTIKTRLRPRQIQSHLRCPPPSGRFYLTKQIVDLQCFLHTLASNKVWLQVCPRRSATTFVSAYFCTSFALFEWRDLFGNIQNWQNWNFQMWPFMKYSKLMSNTLQKLSNWLTFLTLQATYCYFNQLCTCKVQAGGSG